MVFFWAVSLLAAVAGGYELVETTMRATSAPQQAAGAALAVAIAVIPYVFTRCLDAIVASSWRDRVIEHLAALRKDSPPPG
jgi:hypothetical protein